MSHQTAKRERFMGMPADQHTSGRAVQAGGGEGCKSCPTSCPALGPNGCTIAVGNRALELLGKHVNAFGERKEEAPEDLPVAIEVRVVNGRRDRE